MDVVRMIEAGAFLGLCALLLLRCQVWTFGNDISIGILPHSLPGVEYPGTFCSCLGILLAVTGNMPLYNPLVIGRPRMGIDGGQGLIQAVLPCTATQPHSAQSLQLPISRNDGPRTSRSKDVDQYDP